MIPRDMRSAPLGRLLIDTGVLTQAEIDEAIAVQRTDKRRLGEILIERALVHPQELAQLGDELQIPNANSRET